jgi:hypothetical protein
LVVHGKLVAIEPEIVNWRTGGVIKNAVTLGLDKGHVNGTVAGPRSKTTVATTPLAWRARWFFTSAVWKEIRHRNTSSSGFGRRAIVENFAQSPAACFT